MSQPLSCLSAGTFGSAAVSYPSVLPLVDLIAQQTDVLGATPAEFFKELLANTMTGLKAEGDLFVVWSELTYAGFNFLDSPVLLGCYSDCLLYGVLTLAKRDGQQDAALALLQGPLLDSLKEHLSSEVRLFVSCSDEV